MYQALDQAIGTAPASSVDVDELVARGRRRGAWRRLAVAGAAGGSLVAVGVVAAVVLSSAGRAAVVTQVQPAASGPTQADGTAPVRAGETTEQAKQRLAAALTLGLTAALAGVTVADAPTGQPGVLVYAGSGQDPRYDTDTLITTPAGKSEVFLVSQPGGPTPTTPPPTGSPSGQPAPPVAITWFESCAEVPTAQAFTGDGKPLVEDCQDSIGPDGQKVVALSERCPECAGQPTLWHDVYVTWHNARVDLSISHDLKRGDAHDSLTAPLLTREQLVAIAVDPDLTVTA